MENLWSAAPDAPPDAAAARRPQPQWAPQDSRRSTIPRRPGRRRRFDTSCRWM